MRKANIPYADDRTKMLHGEQYWFYDHSTALTRCPMLYKQIIERASHSISIWDPYFNVMDTSNSDRPKDDDSKLFAYIRQGVHFRYLLNKPEIKQSTYQEWENSISKNVHPDIKPMMNVKFSNISVKNEDHFSKFWQFHDRFLIIDRRDVYLVGASVGYHLNPTHTTGICKLEHERDILLVIEQFDRYWNMAKKLNGIYEMKL